jgi:hypothetical protein
MLLKKLLSKVLDSVFAEEDECSSKYAALRIS